MSLREAIDRTLRLMRDELVDAATDDALVEALTGTEVALVADAVNLQSHSAQTAVITAALLMGRSAHKVYLDVPDVPLLGAQPPLSGGRLAEQLEIVGRDLLPDVEFHIGRPFREVALVIALGDSPVKVPTRRAIRLHAGPWAGEMVEGTGGRRWPSIQWPFGGLVAGALAAGEAFKVAMNALLPLAERPDNTAERFAFSRSAGFALAPEGTPLVPRLGHVDFISGGAVSNGALFALARVPGVELAGRIIEPEKSDLSNLNRYMLLRRSRLESEKARDLAKLLEGIGRLEPVSRRYVAATAKTMPALAERVVVGVDDIPVRWEVQRAWPRWLTIGATSHWSAQASYHQKGLSCAECLHYRDEPGNGPIPTTACVSFWAGLLCAGYVLRDAAGAGAPAQEQQVFFSPFRADRRPHRMPVPVLPDCPTCSRDRQ